MVKKFRGQALVEYGLVLALIAITTIIVLGVMGNAVVSILQTVATALTNA
jgi:Flp pilus assembly pilin Flp